MNTRLLIPLCAAAALLAACSDRDGENVTGTATEPAPEAVGVGDTATTPGGNAGDASTTPPSTASSPGQDASDPAPPSEPR